MKFELDGFNRNSSDEELLKDLKRVSALLSKQRVTIDEYNDRGRFHSTTLTRRFGSWFAATDKAGLQRTRHLNISNDELFANLVVVWTNLGKQPRYSDLIPKMSTYSAGTYENRFGTWRKALQAFVDWANEREAPQTVDDAPSQFKRRTPRTINWRLRALVLMRDGALCKLCGAKPEDNVRLHVDHVLPWSKGGETIFENLQILCEVCNVGKSNLQYDSRA